MQKQTFVYPSSDLDRGRVLLSVLGSFWSRTYTAKDQVLSYVTATALQAAQTYQNLLETVSAVSRYEIPVFHKQYWTPIVIKASDLVSAEITSRYFDDGTALFDDGVAVFNSNAGANFFTFAAPTKLVKVGQLFNRILFPTASLTEDVNYVVDAKNDRIVFAKNPFDNPAFLRKPTLTNGKADEEIVLWGFNGQFDYDLVFNQFAYALGMRLTSSENFKDLMNAVFDGLISGGATVKDLDLALSAICGIPVVLEAEELVEVVDYDNHGLFIVTDKNAYRFNAAALPVVSAGQQVTAGMQLIRGFEIDEFFVGSTYSPLTSADCCPAPANLLATDDYSQLTTEAENDILLDPNTPACRIAREPLSALAVGNGFMAACFYGDLVFENKSVPLVVDATHPTGYTYVQFEVGGLPADVDQFFDEIHYRGVTEANAPQINCPPGVRRHTLAQFLDRRPQPLGEPQANHLPSTINPLRFLIENVLRNNVFVVKIIVSALGQNHLGLYNIRHLRQLLPPGTAMIAIFELAAGLDRLDGENDVQESITTFKGVEPATDTVPVELLRDVGVTVRLFSGTCQ